MGCLCCKFVAKGKRGVEDYVVTSPVGPGLVCRGRARRRGPRSKEEIVKLVETGGASVDELQTALGVSGYVSPKTLSRLATEVAAFSSTGFVVSNSWGDDSGWKAFPMNVAASDSESPPLEPRFRRRDSVVHNYGTMC